MVKNRSNENPYIYVYIYTRQETGQTLRTYYILITYKKRNRVNTKYTRGNQLEKKYTGGHNITRPFEQPGQTPKR